MQFEDFLKIIHILKFRSY